MRNQDKLANHASRNTRPYNPGDGLRRAIGRLLDRAQLGPSREADWRAFGPRRY